MDFKAENGLKTQQMHDSKHLDSKNILSIIVSR